MPEKHQYFNGLMFTRDETTGYYLCSKKTDGNSRKRMHVYVWEYYNGKVPKGYEIHHADGDKSNNNISNLQCLAAETHRKYHADNISEEQIERLRNAQKKAILKAPDWHKSEEGKKWHKQHGKKTWANRTHNEYVCTYCGKRFETLNAYSLGSNTFCSNKCKSAYRRKSGVDNVMRKCELCGKEFEINKYAKKRFCSVQCSFKAVPRGGNVNRNR